MTTFAAIVPVFNRPDEVDELLQSMLTQSRPFDEILIIEDGSSRPCKHVVDNYADRLPITYYEKENSGQGFSRNFGFERASSDYLIVFDSDCILPNQYLELVHEGVTQRNLDAFGGPDRAMDTFTPIQKAISYSMTSPFTTGGIRGNAQHTGRFHPRSFNMGITREVFEKTGGYIITRMGEDIEFSIRIINAGFKVDLLEEAFVFHKRRTSFGQFFRQLRFFGRARVNVSRFFPAEIKLVHTLPAFFLIGQVLWILSLWVYPYWWEFGAWANTAFCMLIFLDASRTSKSPYVGALSVIAAYIQLLAYGSGLITEGLKKIVRN